MMTLIKRVLLMREFEEALDRQALLRVGPSGPENVSCKRNPMASLIL